MFFVSSVKTATEKLVWSLNICFMNPWNFTHKAPKRHKVAEVSTHRICSITIWKMLVRGRGGLGLVVVKSQFWRKKKIPCSFPFLFHIAGQIVQFQLLSKWIKEDKTFKNTNFSFGGQLHWVFKAFYIFKPNSHASGKKGIQCLLDFVMMPSFLSLPLGTVLG